jgi:hypothetical protein
MSNADVTLGASVTTWPHVTEGQGVTTYVSVTAGAFQGDLLLMSTGILLLMTGGSLLLL